MTRPTVKAVPIVSMTTSVVCDSTMHDGARAALAAAAVRVLREQKQQRRPDQHERRRQPHEQLVGRGASRPVGNASTSAAKGTNARFPSQVPSVKSQSELPSVSAARNHR